MDDDDDRLTPEEFRNAYLNDPELTVPLGRVLASVVEKYCRCVPDAQGREQEYLTDLETRLRDVPPHQFLSAISYLCDHATGEPHETVNGLYWILTMYETIQ